MTIMHNDASMTTLGILNKNSSSLAKDLKKVSSGMKLTSAGDDASGYAISERMRAQIRSLAQDTRNTQNGTALLKVAEGAVSSTVDILRTLKAKAIDAANDTNTDTDRATLQKELDQSADQIDDNALVTFNGKYLVDGSHNRKLAATKTARTNEMLSTSTTGTTAFTDMADRNGQSLAIQSGDTVTMSWVKQGETHSVSVDGTGTIEDLLEKANETSNANAKSTTIKTWTINGVSTTDESQVLRGVVLVWDTSQQSLDGRVMTAARLNAIKNSLESYLNNFSSGMSSVAAASYLKGVTFVYNGKNYRDMMPYYREAAYASISVSERDENHGGLKVGEFYGADSTIRDEQYWLTFDRILSSSGETLYTVLLQREQKWGLFYPQSEDDLRLYDPRLRAFPGLEDYKDPIEVTTQEVKDGNEPENVFEATTRNGSNLGDDGTGGTVTTADGKNAVTITAFPSGLDGQVAGLTFKVTDSQGKVRRSATEKLNAFDESIRAENASEDNALVIHTGTKANQNVKVYLTDMRSEALGLKSSTGKTISIGTQAQANAAINVLDTAVQKALDEQTRIGAYESRLDFTTQNLTTAEENVRASESTIRDADMAKEMTSYMKESVLLQASQSMLAQSNQTSSNVLSLLQ